MYSACCRGCGYRMSPWRLSEIKRPLCDTFARTKREPRRSRSLLRTRSFATNSPLNDRRSRRQRAARGGERRGARSSWVGFTHPDMRRSCSSCFRRRNSGNSVDHKSSAESAVVCFFDNHLTAAAVKLSNFEGGWDGRLMGENLE